MAFDARITRKGSFLKVTDPEGRTVEVEGAEPEEARRFALDEEILSQRLAKTGGTPYRCVDIKAKVEEDLTLSAAAINAMRRDALNQLTAVRARHDLPQLGKAVMPRQRHGVPGAPALTVQVTRRDQITAKLLKMETAMLYVPMHILLEDYDLCMDLAERGNVAVALPRIIHDSQMEKLQENLTTLRGYGIRDALVSNIGQLIPVREADMRLRGDFGLNLYNSGALLMAMDMEFASATLSFEMTLPQIRYVSKCIPC